MNINQMYLSGDPMLPSSPFLTGESEEFTHFIPLSWSPEEIHPQTVSITFVIEKKELIRNWVSLMGFIQNWPKEEMHSVHGSGDDYVFLGFKYHEIHGNDPSKPSVIISFGLERVENTGMISDHLVNPSKR